MKNEQDKDIRALIDSMEALPEDIHFDKPLAWNRLEEQLKPPVKRKITPYAMLPAAAVLLLLIFIGFRYYHSKTSDEFAAMGNKLPDVKDVADNKEERLPPAISVQKAAAANAVPATVSYMTKQKREDTVTQFPVAELPDKADTPVATVIVQAAPQKQKMKVVYLGDVINEERETKSLLQDHRMAAEHRGLLHRPDNSNHAASPQPQNAPYLFENLNSN